MGLFLLLSRSLSQSTVVSLWMVTQTQPAKRCKVLQRVGSGMCSSFSESRTTGKGQRGYYSGLGSAVGITKGTHAGNTGYLGYTCPFSTRQPQTRASEALTPSARRQ
ncbi:hypothetical protein B0I72DRAFT_134386 [Yarrowia lipolytica]|uniref:Uncharacterized protein n=1 Tax=Yarrowia lipolytica TaxID=4952 RepID=A0A371C5J0_YARLL|nr:hypothetical protein B0I71DRAFT_132923 [Yarrowia lipolytica]RDW34580.1 hypothetical protein B0I72DRAFT_134386 [Yarrowia lipolytica]RDW38884.1 hypothetical protein B0I73DRAFT_133004 [Yarrowia lipolytica]RDW49315.1 hypothetical protein B0I74DRAFT_132264 [Yarrowia lipolytica]RDW55903.1 hypothetical protein B0I75DRAFT_132370 [Yarrowia lipolytica]